MNVYAIAQSQAQRTLLSAGLLRPRPLHVLCTMNSRILNYQSYGVKVQLATIQSKYIHTVANWYAKSKLDSTISLKRIAYHDASYYKYNAVSSASSQDDFM